MSVSVSVSTLAVAIGVGLAAVPAEGRQLAASAPPDASLAHIEANPTGPPVTLGALLEEALARNPDLAALRATVDSARHRPPQQRALDAPMLEAQIWQWPVASLNPANANMYMLMVTQDLPRRSKRELRAAVAEKDVALADSDLAIRTREVLAQVKQAYAELSVSRHAIRVYRDSIDLLRQMADVAQAKYTTGRLSQQDVLKPIVELSRLHSDLIILEGQARLASARLNVLRNRPPDTPIGPLVELPEPALLPSAADLERLALERQAELQRARLEVERAEAELASARSEYLPDVLVQGGYMLAPRMADGWTARVGVTWPRAPWSRSRADARIAEQTGAVRAARARLQALENGVRLSVHEAYVRARSAQERAALLRTTILPQARQTLDVSRVAYQTDRVEFQTLLDNERVLLDTQLAYHQAVGDFAQALADLERAAGIDLPPGATTTASTQEEQ